MHFCVQCWIVWPCSSVFFWGNLWWKFIEHEVKACRIKRIMAQKLWEFRSRTSEWCLSWWLHSRTQYIIVHDVFARTSEFSFSPLRRLPAYMSKGASTSWSICVNDCLQSGQLFSHCVPQLYRNQPLRQWYFFDQMWFSWKWSGASSYRWMHSKQKTWLLLQLMRPARAPDRSSEHMAQSSWQGTTWVWSHSDCFCSSVPTSTPSFEENYVD